MICPLGMPTRKPCEVAVFSEHLVELWMRLLVQPESRAAFSGEEGTNVLVVVMLHCWSRLLFVPTGCQARSRGLFFVEPPIVSPALAPF